MKITGIDKSIKKVAFIGALSAMALFRANNVAHAEEIGTTSSSAIEADSKETSIEDILNTQLKTELEEAETSVAKKRIEKLQDRDFKIFAYKEFLSKNSDGKLKNDVLMAYVKDKGTIILDKGKNNVIEKEDISLEILDVLSDTEKQELFEIVKTKYTEYVESKDWKEQKKEECLRINLQEFEKNLGIYKTPTETHFFTDIEEAEEANFWYELKEVEGKTEKKYEKRVIKLHGDIDPKKELKTPEISQKNTILAGVEYTNSEGERKIAYMYIVNNSKSGTIRCTELEGLSDEEKQKLFELANEKYEQILEDKDEKMYKHIDDWHSEMNVAEEYYFTTIINRDNPDYKEGESLIHRHRPEDKEDKEKDEKTEPKKDKEDKEKDEKTEPKKDKEYKEKDEKTEPKKTKEDKEKDEKTEPKKDKEYKEKDEKTEPKKDKEDKEKDEKEEPKKAKEYKEKDEKTESKKDKEDKEKDEKTEPKKDKEYKEKDEKTEPKKDKEDKEKDEKIETKNEKQPQLDITENMKEDKSIYKEEILENPLKKEEIKVEKVRGEVRIGDKPPQKKEITPKKRISIQGLRNMTSGARSEEIKEWINTLQNEVNNAIEKLTNEKEEENEK